MGEINLPRMLKRNWKKQAIRKGGKLTQKRGVVSISMNSYKRRKPGKTIKVKVGNSGPKEGAVSIMTSTVTKAKSAGKASNSGPKEGTISILI